MRYVFETKDPIETCSDCPMLSYNAKVCQMGWVDSVPESTNMLNHATWLFVRKPEWCPLNYGPDVAMSKTLYVPVTQFFMDDYTGFAYGTLGKAFRTYDEARQFLLDGGWKSDIFVDDVFGDVEFFSKDNGDDARIDEATVG